MTAHNSTWMYLRFTHPEGEGRDRSASGIVNGAVAGIGWADD
jgi:hypothetical protein